ncbi:hypothetical protein Tsubulata_014079 [Turnera subulata]|uniref:Uncharacterized protein n=1 Tax=Turnera subulata TaxID=218843 RepID=A0A9Q0G423_9ROSI|nr:hypothetical protein Tsubulata_014079 [Turnera subulata]
MQSSQDSNGEAGTSSTDELSLQVDVVGGKKKERIFGLGGAAGLEVRIRRLLKKTLMSLLVKMKVVRMMRFEKLCVLVSLCIWCAFKGYKVGFLHVVVAVGNLQVFLLGRTSAN